MNLNDQNIQNLQNIQNIPHINKNSSLPNSSDDENYSDDEIETTNKTRHYETLQEMELSDDMISCLMGGCNRVNNANEPNFENRRNSNAETIECRFLQAEKSLEWCLKQLTQLSIHKSLGAMANEKYKEIIRQEFDKKEHSSSVTEFITSTFFERDRIQSPAARKEGSREDKHDSLEKKLLEKNLLEKNLPEENLQENTNFEKKNNDCLPSAVRPMPIVNEISAKPNTEFYTSKQTSSKFHDSSIPTSEDKSFKGNFKNRIADNTIIENTITENTITENKISHQIMPKKSPILSKNSSLASIFSESSCLPPAVNHAENTSITEVLNSEIHIRPETEDEENATQHIIENIKKQNTKQQKRPLGPKLIENHVIYCRGLKSVPQIQTNLVMGMDDWNGVNIFNLTEITRGRPMTTLFWAIMEKKDHGGVKMMSHFKFNKRKLLCWLLHIEDHYRDLPYHNRSHSADVLHSTYVLLNFASMDGVFDKVEQLAAYVAAAIHDVDHPGQTSLFHSNTYSDLAILYNDESILENHHLAVAFKLMFLEPCDAIPSAIRSTEWQRFRRLVISMVQDL